MMKSAPGWLTYLEMAIIWTTNLAVATVWRKINEIIQGAEALLSADNFEEKGWQVTYHYSSIQ